MGELLIGTSGYDYPDWKGGFYPEKLARAKFLEYYSEHFNSLELNGTYYRMPTAEQMQKMIDKSGGRVRFSVKAFQDLTHASYANAYADRSKYQILIFEFKKALEPLLNSNLLVCALFQFPESFHYEKEERLYLDLLLKEIGSVPVVVEMRNNKWRNDQVYNALRERNTGWCITDSPLTAPGNGDVNIEDVWRITSDIAYMRFHGRNSDMWYKGDNVSRYDYMYPDAELKTFVNPILELLKHARIVQLFFNNHAKSQAVVNAKKLEMLLKEMGKENQ
jgi:uncharacterized protein YecE (DUF72 family)